MPAQPTATGDDIDIADLPPLDGDDDPAAVRPAGDDEDVGSDASAADLDDATGENDAPHPDDLEVDAGEGKWLEEPADARDLDIGEVDIDTTDAATSSADGDEGGGAADEGPPVGEGLEAGGLDSGEEGPEAPDEELREQDLPDLGEAEDDEVGDDLTSAELPPSEEPLGLGWAAKPWTRVGAPTPIGPALAVARAARGAFVVGVSLEAPSTRRSVELLRVDLEGGCQVVGVRGVTSPLTGLAANGELLVVRTDSREVFASRDGGDFELVSGRVQIAEMVVASDGVWLRSDVGKLFSVAPERGLLVEQSTGAMIVSLAVDGAGQVVALLVDPAGRALGVVRSLPDGSLQREELDFGEAAAAYGNPLPGVVAGHGARLGYATRQGLVSGSAAEGWVAQALGGQVVALSFVDGGQALVAVVYSDADDTTGVVRVEPGSPPRVMALLGPTPADIESDGRAFGLASDDTRGVVWVVGGFGVAAFSTR
jgi:hypothetical protein